MSEVKVLEAGADSAPLAVQRPPVNGDWIETTDGDSVIISQFFEPVIVATPVEPDIFTTANEAVTINGNPAAGFQSVYFGVNGNTANMSFYIVDDLGVLQTQLDSVSLGYPPVLALPVMKVANGDDTNVVDEVYFSTTLVEGVIAVAGSFPASGNWKMTTARINAALAEIGAAWVIDKPDVTFRINS